jgi:histidyl-tRNA synthetase
MISATPPAGMVDQVGQAAERFERTVASLRTAFRRYGLEPVIPPVIERAEQFLDRSGEDLRSRLYLFTDPGGREICLRPELTIPTVRLYADQFKGDGRALRCYYIGPVFRYDYRSEGRYRQFTQAGAELIGGEDTAMADAEAVALANHALRSCMLDDLTISLSDISFFTSLLDPDVLPPKWISRLRSLATDPRKLGAFLDEQLTETPSESNHLDYLRAVSSVEPQLRREIVGDLVRSLQPTEHFGSRSIEDIVNRTLELADVSEGRRLSRKVAEALRELLAVDLPLPAGLEAVADIAKQAGAEQLQRVVSSWDRKVTLLDAFGLDVGRIQLDLRVGRGMDYYSSFVFEISAGEPDALDQLCAGGRYDELVRSIGKTEVPAVGFAIGVERVLLAQLAPEESGPVEPPDVLVVAAGDVADDEVIRATTELRERGLAAVHLPGRRVRYGLTQALKRGVRYLAIVGEREAEANHITVRDLETRRERSVSVSQAVSIIARSTS